MKKFSELGIKPRSRRFVGPKVEVDDIINKEIAIHDFKIEPSKYPKEHSKMVAHMQIEIDGKKKVMWSASGFLMDMLEQVQKEDFPIKTTIIRDAKALLFT